MDAILEISASASQKDALVQPIVDVAVKGVQHNAQLFRWALPKPGVDLLNSFGISAHSHGVQSHSHPIHKTHETDLLFTKWLSRADVPSTVLYMKPAKFLKLSAKNSNFQCLINQHHVALDLNRYPEQDQGPVTTKYAFMHDALMYLTPAKIAGLFEQSPKLEKLWASVIHPAEASLGFRSFMPALYQTRVQDTQLQYFLEGSADGAYTQPLDCNGWLTTAGISTPHFQLSVTLVATHGPFHEFLITRKVLKTELIRSFHCPEAILIPQPHFNTLPLAHRLVPKEIKESLFDYVKSVRTLRTTDPMAVLRTHHAKPEFAWVAPEAWTNLNLFALDLAEEQPQLAWRQYNTKWAQLKAWLLHYAPGWAPIPMLAASTALAVKPLLKERFFYYRPGLWTLIRLLGPTGVLKRQFSGDVLKWPQVFWKAPWYKAWFFRPRPRDLIPKFYTWAYTDAGVVTCSFSTHAPRTLTSRLLDIFCVLAAGGISCFAIWKFLNHVDIVGKNSKLMQIMHPPPFELTLKTNVVAVQAEDFFNLPLKDDQEVLPTLPAHVLPPLVTGESEPMPSQGPPAEPEPQEPPELRAPKSEMYVVEEDDEDSQDDEEDSSKNSHSGPTQRGPVLKRPAGAILPKLPPLAATQLTIPMEESPIKPGTRLQTLREWHPRLPWWPAGGTALTTVPEGVPLPEFLGPDCLLVALQEATQMSHGSLWHALSSGYSHAFLHDEDSLKNGLSIDHIEFLAAKFRWKVHIRTDHTSIIFGPENSSPVFLRHSGPSQAGHWSAGSQTDFRVGAGAKCSSTPLRSLLQNAPVPLPVTKVRILTPEPSRAKTLLTNLRYGFDGVFSQLQPHGRLNPQEMMDAWSNSISLGRPPVEVILIQGFAGCGKSYAVSKVLRTRRDYVVATPTTHLRDAWKNDLGLQNSKETWRASTWEMALTRASKVLVIDEVYKLPPGYVDLALYANRTVEAVILLGDPLQGAYHSTCSQSTLRNLSPETDRLRPFADIYCFWTRRLSLSVANALGVYTTSKEVGRIRPFDFRLPESKLTLTPAQETAGILETLGHDSMTAAGSQGLTVNSNVGIFLDSHTLLLSPNVALVAITRSRRDIIWSGDGRILEQLASSHPFSVLVNSTQNILSSFPTVLDGLTILNHPDCMPSGRTVVRGGLRPKNSPPFNPDYAEDILVDRRRPIRSSGPNLIPLVDDFFVPESKRVLLHNVQDATPEPPSFEIPSPTSAEPGPVYPGCDYECLRHTYARSENPFDLDKYHNGVHTNQFPHLNEPYELEVESPTLVAPIHNPRADPTLLSSSIEKRLRFTKASVSRITPKEQIAGDLLFRSYLSAHCLPATSRPFDPVLFASCISENEYIQLTSKTRAILIANANRSDPELEVTMARIFPKSQHKVNINSLMGAWKACQTLALLHDSVVLFLGPVKKYQRAVLREASGNKLIFTYGGKSPRDMSEFAKKHFPAGTKRVANDYSAFDQSQRGESTHFEVLKMNYFGLPPAFSEFHVFLKMNLKCQFGRLAPMRFTGEPGTYDDNTDYNLAILNLEYDLSGVPTMVSGDDSLLAWHPPVRSSWISVAPLFSLLTWKKEHSLYGEFCGYYVSSCGAVRAPRPLLIKLAIAKARGELDLTLPSYVAEFSVGHSLGDELWLALPTSETMYQSAVYDFICRHASKDLKVMLKPGEVPEDILARMDCAVSRPVFALLSSQQRWAYLQARKPRFMSWAVNLREQFLEAPRERLVGGLIANSSSRSIHQSTNEMSKPVQHAAPAPAASVQSSDSSERGTDRPYHVPLPPPAASIVAVDTVVAPGLTRPFQHWIHRYNADAKLEVNTLPMMSLQPLLDMMSIARVGQLVELSVLILPHANVIKHACHVDVAWSPAEIQPTKNSICSLPGARRLVFGGVSAISPIDIACNLTCFNPTLKGPVSYNGTPRLNLSFTGTEGANSSPSVDIYVRGRIHLSYPELALGNAPT